MEYLKLIHVTTVVLSFCGFFIRGIWMILASDMLLNKWVKVLPHVIDATLLCSALLMLYFSQWSVIENTWLQVKIVALLVYIGLGMVTLKFGQTLRVRVFAWLAGLVVFLFIVSVAMSKSVFGFLTG